MGDQLKGFALAHREVISWKSVDGTTIEGVVYKPAGFDPTRKYPLLVVIHGGPPGVEQPIGNAAPFYPIERFVATGALGLRPHFPRPPAHGEKLPGPTHGNTVVREYAQL